MLELIIAKIDEFMDLEIEGETEDESDSRDFILGTLKSCVSQAKDLHIRSIIDRDQDRIELIAVRQTINVFQALYSRAGLRKMKGSIKFGSFLADLSDMTYVTDNEAISTV